MKNKSPCKDCPMKKCCLTNNTDIRHECRAYIKWVGFDASKDRDVAEWNMRNREA
jgi:hypothetical protein